MKKLLLFLSVLTLAVMLSSCGKLKDKITGGSDSLEISQQEAEANMNNLANEQGYQIAFTYSDGEENGTYNYGCKDDIMWCKSTDNYGESGFAYKLVGNEYEYYTLDELGNYIYQYSFEASEYEDNVYAMTIGYTYWIYYGFTYDGSLTKLGSTTIAGRKATEYEFNLGAALGIIGKISGVNSYKYKIAVDDELGITLKLELSVDVKDESGTLSYEVTSFKTGNNITDVPSLGIPG